MPELDTGFSRSTLRELVDQAHSDFDAESLPNTRLALSWLNPLVSLTASAAHLAHGLIAYGIRQLFADTASLAYLLRHGRMRGIELAVATFAARLDALSARGVDVEALEFEGKYGRTSLEYYDGFVFGFYAARRPDLPPVATGGRYDALTRMLGQGRAVPAVGAVIRPELVVRLREGRA